jgi:hypothetical protein
MAALVAFIDVTTQFLGPTIRNRRERGALLARQAVLGTIGGTVVPEDVADFKRWVGQVRRDGAGVCIRLVHDDSLAADEGGG